MIAIEGRKKATKQGSKKARKAGEREAGRQETGKQAGRKTGRQKMIVGEKAGRYYDGTTPSTSTHLKLGSDVKTGVNPDPLCFLKTFYANKHQQTLCTTSLWWWNQLRSNILQHHRIVPVLMCCMKYCASLQGQEMQHRH